MATLQELEAVIKIRNEHPFIRRRIKLLSRFVAAILLDAEEAVAEGMTELEAIDTWKGVLRKIMEWSTNIDHSNGGLKMWDTCLATSQDVLTRLNGSKLDQNYAKEPIFAVHEHLMTNMAILDYRHVFTEGGDLSVVTERVRIFLEKRATVFITKDEEKIFSAVKAKQGKKTVVVRESVHKSMSPSFNPLTSSPLDRYIAAGYDFSNLVINPMWVK